MTESVILAAIRKRLERETDLVLWRLSYGITDDDDNDTPRKRYRAGLSVRGGSDLIGILKVKKAGYPHDHESIILLRDVGRFLALECKTPAHLGRIRSAIARNAIAKLSKTDQHQIMFLGVVRSMGGFGAFVDSEESAVAALDRARRGESE